MAVVFAERPLSKLVGTLSACVGAQLAVFGIPDERIAAEFAHAAIVGLLGDQTFH